MERAKEITGYIVITMIIVVTLAGFVAFLLPGIGIIKADAAFAIMAISMVSDVFLMTILEQLN